MYIYIYTHIYIIYMYVCICFRTLVGLRSFLARQTPSRLKLLTLMLRLLHPTPSAPGIQSPTPKRSPGKLVPESFPLVSAPETLRGSMFPYTLGSTLATHGRFRIACKGQVEPWGGFGVSSTSRTDKSPI